MSARLDGLMQEKHERWFLIGITLVTALLLFPNLGDISLWTDEAETAVIGRNILTFGAPVMYDGRNLMTYYPPLYNDQYVEVVLPWLQYYVTAASFALFGMSTATARLPFALCGVLTVVLFYRLVRRLDPSRWVATTATLLAGTSIPFLLLMRQCRYYALTALFTVWLVSGYLDLIERRRGGVWQVIAAAALLFHSHYVVCLGMVAGLGIHWLLHHRTALPIKAVAGTAAGFLALTVPWVVYARFWQHSYVWFSPMKGFDYYAQYLLDLNEYVVPPLLWAVLGGLLIARPGWRVLHIVAAAAVWLATIRALPGAGVLTTVLIGVYLFLALRWARRQGGQASSCSLVVLLIGVVPLVLALLSPHQEFRYVVGLVPLCYLAVAWTLDHLRQTRPVLAGGCVAALMFTTLFTALPFRAVRLVVPSVEQVGGRLYDRGVWPITRWFPDRDRWVARLRLIDGAISRQTFSVSTLSDYLYELTHDYAGPIEGIVAYLRQHGQVDDTVKIDYGAVSLMFYTTMRMIPEDRLTDESVQADWVIIHQSNWLHVPSRFLEHLARSYERIVLPYPDLQWDNRPELRYHYFRVPHDEPRIVIYHRRRATVPDRM